LPAFFKGNPGYTHRELFDFDKADRGKTVSFCIRLENAKGAAGPWGPLLSTIIP
jgi:hypothetical protein